MLNNFTPSTDMKTAQCHTILDHLRKYGEVSTVGAREDHGVMSPAARIMELRRAGHEIATERRTIWDISGKPHTSAVYVLRRAKDA